MNDKLKVFISQPMKDRTKEELIEERLEIIKYLNFRYGVDNYEIINPLPDKMKNLTTDKARLKALSKSINILADADLCVCTSGWMYASGCKVERLCCTEYHIEIMDF